MNKVRSELTRASRLAVLGWILAVLLAGCRDADLGELQYVLEKSHAMASDTTQSSVTRPMSEMPADYLFGDKRSPFERPSMSPAIIAVERSGIMPEDGRPAEPLEAFTLDELRLVGTLSFNSQSSALVRDPTGKVHRLSVGSRLGSNFGRVTDITVNEVGLIETVPVGGGWVERINTLVMGD